MAGDGLDKELDKLGLKLTDDQRAKLRTSFDKGKGVTESLQDMGFTNVNDVDFSGVKAILKAQTPEDVTHAQEVVDAAPKGSINVGETGGGGGPAGGGESKGGGDLQLDDNQTATETILSPEQQKIVDLAMPYAKDFAKTDLQPYQDVVAGFTPEQLAGQQMALDAVGTQNALAASGASSLTSMLGMDPKDFSGVVMDQPGLVSSKGVVRNAQDVASFVDPNKTTGDFLTNTDLLDASSNPYLSSAIEAAIRPISDTLMQETLPGIRGEAVTSGNFGSSRQGVAEGIAISKSEQEMSDLAAQMASEGYGQGLSAMGTAYGDILGTAASTYGTEVGNETARQATEQQAATELYNTQQNATNTQYATQQGAQTDVYGNNLNAQNQALSLLPTVQTAQTTGALTTSGVGDVKQQQTERENQEAADQAMFAQYAPLASAQGLLGLMPGIPGGTNVSTGAVPQTNPITGAVGGAVTGATLGSVIPGVGTAGGALAGGVIGATQPLWDDIFSTDKNK